VSRFAAFAGADRHAAVPANDGFVCANIPAVAVRVQRTSRRGRFEHEFSVGDAGLRRGIGGVRRVPRQRVREAFRTRGATKRRRACRPSPRRCRCARGLRAHGPDVPASPRAGRRPVHAASSRH